MSRIHSVCKLIITVWSFEKESSLKADEEKSLKKIMHILLKTVKVAHIEKHLASGQERLYKISLKFIFSSKLEVMEPGDTFIVNSRYIKKN